MAGCSFPLRAGANERRGNQSGGGGGIAPVVDVLQHLAGAIGHRDQGIIRNGHGQLGFLGYQSVDASQKSAAAGHHNAAVHEIAGKLRWTLLEDLANGFEDGGERFPEGVPDFLGPYGEGAG